MTEPDAVPSENAHRPDGDSAEKPQKPRGRRILTRIAIGVPVTAVVLAAGLYAATAVLDIPSPPTLARLLTDAPSGQGQLYPARPVAASPNQRPFPVADAPLPDTVPWKGTQIPVADFLEATDTNAFLVLRDGVLTHEWYRDGVGPTTQMASWSMAKSVVSLMIGREIEAGKLSEDDRLVDILPDLATGDEYDAVTIRNLLDMTSGIDVSENYNPYFPLTGTARMYLTQDLGEFVRDHRGLQFPPGSEGEYRSVDTQLLGQVLAEVEGTSLTELLQRDIWAPMGAQDAATWNLDRDGGEEKAFCCINATTRDFAKIGQLVLDGGIAHGTQIVPPAWIARVTSPAPHQVSSWGYSAQWWHPIGGDGQDLSAIGVYGQFIYVDPGTGTVIVKLSDHGAEQDEQETFDVMRAIAAFR
ncbi:serine hydrolase domain-containing protein [Rhodococcus sp. OK302]|uniref:serine hydrolase domain-containing protein n=1 Tax=Rhodococcus sp. OK302 TaxID=1882769 RepID=UPI000B93D1FD|nr:serine hydrolase [Rhodococcus sp. OK302]OYD67395.1 CubicO group peptidase (beta-lactamase class C family) [Rhodococcus sp. OK302]